MSLLLEAALWRRLVWDLESFQTSRLPRMLDPFTGNGPPAEFSPILGVLRRRAAMHFGQFSQNEPKRTTRLLRRRAQLLAQLSRKKPYGYPGSTGSATLFGQIKPCRLGVAPLLMP